MPEPLPVGAFVIADVRGPAGPVRLAATPDGDLLVGVPGPADGAGAGWADQEGRVFTCWPASSLPVLAGSRARPVVALDPHLAPSDLAETAGVGAGRGGPIPLTDTAAALAGGVRIQVHNRPALLDVADPGPWCSRLVGLWQHRASGLAGRLADLAVLVDACARTGTVPETDVPDLGVLAELSAARTLAGVLTDRPPAADEPASAWPAGALAAHSAEIGWSDPAGQAAAPVIRTAPSRRRQRPAHR